MPGYVLSGNLPGVRQGAAHFVRTCVRMRKRDARMRAPRRAFLETRPGLTQTPPDFEVNPAGVFSGGAKETIHNAVFVMRN